MKGPDKQIGQILSNSSFDWTSKKFCGQNCWQGAYFIGTTSLINEPACGVGTVQTIEQGNG